MYYDLHIHSCLSPCGADEMTVNNICNMALIKGLDLISITDHNSTHNSTAFEKVARRLGLRVIFGVEIQTVEEVHILGYFRTLKEIAGFQLWLDNKLIKVPNRPEYFGRQQILDENDEVTATYDNLLLMSVDADIDECCKAVHQHGGRVVLAHATERANSICTQLGFIPETLDFDGIEIREYGQKERVLERHPWLGHTIWFVNSDAHQLVDISERENHISEEKLEEFWG